jgi:hypothetical protein
VTYKLIWNTVISIVVRLPSCKAPLRRDVNRVAGLTQWLGDVGAAT